MIELYYDNSDTTLFYSNHAFTCEDESFYIPIKRGVVSRPLKSYKYLVVQGVPKRYLEKCQ